MKKPNKTFSLLSIILILSLLLAACGSNSASNTTSNKSTNNSSNTSSNTSADSSSNTGNKETVSLNPADGVPPWQGRDNERVKINAGFAKGMTGIANQFAIAKGWYSDAGIDLDIVDIPNPVAAFGAGEVDIADGDPGTYIPAIANGVKMKIVSNMWRSRGAYWIIAKPEIKTWADLKGKTIGTGQATGGMPLTLKEVLSQNGIDYKKDVEYAANSFYQEAYASFVKGEVDATIIHQPFATLAEQEGTGHVLAKTWEFVPEYQTGVLVASQKLIDEQPEVVERLLEVYFYANEYAKTHLDEFYPWAAEYLNQDEETIKKAINSEIILWENNPIVDTKRLQVTEDLLTKYGMQREAISVDGVVDNTFADKVAKILLLGKYAKQ